MGYFYAGGVVCVRRHSPFGSVRDEVSQSEIEGTVVKSVFHLVKSTLDLHLVVCNNLSKIPSLGTTLFLSTQTKINLPCRSSFLLGIIPNKSEILRDVSIIQVSK